MKLREPGRQKLGTELLAVDEACKSMLLRSTPGFNERAVDRCGSSIERTFISASSVPHGGIVSGSTRSMVSFFLRDQR